MPEVLIVGQGLAGTLLGWACETASIPFRIADPGSTTSASAASAGILNPITGLRLVKSWRAETLLSIARQTYGRIATDWGVPLWRDMRIHRRFANDREREIFATKSRSGELAPFAGPADEGGFWIEGAAHVDVAALLTTARQRWRAQGRLIETSVDPKLEIVRYGLVVDCRGSGAIRADVPFGFVPWAYSKGELIEVEVADLAPDVILNRGDWVLPLRSGRGCIGATHEPGNTDPTPTDGACDRLVRSAAALTGQNVVPRARRAGIRVNVPDKRPVVGRHPDIARLGIAAGLGAKGALWAPFVAQQWVQHLATDAAFDPEIDVRRFALRR